MPQFLIAIHRHHRPAEPITIEATESQDIDDLNDAMVAAGVRVFVGGLQPPSNAVSISRLRDGSLVESNGHHIQAEEFVNGFWVLNVPSQEEAMEWGRQAAKACRASVEVRQFN